MKTISNIAIVGTGNVASHLFAAFSKAEVNISCVISRDRARGEFLAKGTNALVATQLKALPGDTDLIFLAVNESVVKSLAEELAMFGLPFVHTSGSLPLDVLGSKNEFTGVFYPFQSFTKGVREGELEFPVCIESDNPEFTAKLRQLANKISSNVQELNSQQRLYLHMAGILVNNFTNHLFARATNLIADKKIDPGLLLPIIKETVEKVRENDPYMVQTGPARRQNSEIIKNHLNLLKTYPELQEIYRVLSDSILSYYSKEIK